jgi:glucose-6-phosphate 1-epimerase
MAADVNRLNERFGIQDVVRFERGEGGLPRIVVSSPAAEAQVYLHGAHVTHFQPRGQAPALFVSRATRFTVGEPIRGGIPVIFPWFGPNRSDPSLPMHGTVRLREWSVEAVARRGDDDVELILATTTETAALRLIVTLGGRLDVVMEVKNASLAELKFEQALHTYFAVADIRTVAVHGLKGTEFKDKMQDFRRIRESGDAIHFSGPVDRVYAATRAACTIDDPGNRRRILLEKEHSDTTVVWNPWESGAAKMPDLGNDEWTRFVCVETANAGENAIVLPAGAVHRMRARISLLPA